MFRWKACCGCVYQGKTKWRNENLNLARRIVVDKSWRLVEVILYRTGNHLLSFLVSFSNKSQPPSSESDIYYIVPGWISNTVQVTLLVHNECSEIENCDVTFFEWQILSISNFMNKGFEEILVDYCSLRCWNKSVNFNGYYDTAYHVCCRLFYSVKYYTHSARSFDTMNVKMLPL